MWTGVLKPSMVNDALESKRLRRQKTIENLGYNYVSICWLIAGVLTQYYNQL